MSLARAIFTVGGLTMVSRVLGFLRDIAAANMLGAGPVADAFYIAFRLPNLFRRLFAEGAFSVAFVPVYAGLLETEGKARADAFAREAQAMLLAMLLPLSAAAMAFMPLVVLAVAPGVAAKPEVYGLAVELSIITFPYLVLISLTALQGAVLNALHRYAPFAAAPILFNLCLLAGLAAAPLFPSAGHALAWGEAGAGVVQVLWMWRACRQSGVRLRIVRPRLSPEVRRLLALMGPAAIGAGAMQISVVIDQQIASLLPTGAISHLYYAERLYQLPLGVIGIAVGTALLPILARQVRAGEVEAARDSQCRGIEFALLLSLPAAVALGVAGLPMMNALFAHGKLTPADAAASAAALAGYAIGIPAYVLGKVLSTAFFARENTRTPVKYGLVTVAFSAATGATLALVLDFGVLGIALATGAAAWFNVALMAWGLRRRGLLVADGRLKRALPRILLAALAMGLAVWGLTLPFDGWWNGAIWQRLVAVAALVGGGGAVYFAAALGLGAVRPAELRGLLRRRRPPAAT
ncbi:MAG TPA: murein biosynthesis integral membrane protein MurJ [Alphaproteobacteria bacterium]|nr:murein biosynthesis integral membrane protein MurJ [Alphaproteobacteria bacterium]